MSTVLLSGASGFIGSNLAKALAADGHHVVPLVRGRPSSANTVSWNADSGQIDRAALASVKPDVVINLAGEPIAQRWTPRRRAKIRDSRVVGTTALAEALAAMPIRPEVLISGSAIGYYGARRGDVVLDESSDPGDDFLATTARDWEGATDIASRAGIRVVIGRMGIVLGMGGGALARMLPPFRMGIGGRLGGGRQWMSWISMDDAVAALRFLMAHREVTGPVNLVAPDPVTNAEFTATLGRVLRRPAVVPVPAFVLRALFGTMADNTILASQRVAPTRLVGAGFEFRHTRLEDALRSVLRR